MNELGVAIGKPSNYKSHQNLIDVGWDTYWLKELEGYGTDVSKVIITVDGNYYKELRESPIPGPTLIESRYKSTDVFVTDPVQDLLTSREESFIVVLPEGVHALKIDISGTADDGYGNIIPIDGYGIRNFKVDETVPIIDIISPTEYDVLDLTTIGRNIPTLTYTINGIENPIDFSLVNVRFQKDDGYGIYYSTSQTSDGYGDVLGFIDGYGDKGRIPSGTVLSNMYAMKNDGYGTMIPMRAGTYNMRIVVQDDAGNIGSAYRRFSFNVPFEFSEAPSDIWIGSDLNGQNQSDSVIEQLTIRNVAITDDEAAMDYLTGLRGLPLRTVKESRLVFSIKEEATIRQLAIDILTASGELPTTLTSVEQERRIAAKEKTIKSHLNDTNRILLLSNFNVEIEPTDGADNLEKAYNPVIREKLSLNELQITVLQKTNEVIDKDLLADLIEKIKPTHMKVLLKFEEVQ